MLALSSACSVGFSLVGTARAPARPAVSPTARVLVAREVRIFGRRGSRDFIMQMDSSCKSRGIFFSFFCFFCFFRTSE